jgi:CBS domain containing-hemolysin-like protein
MADALIGLAVVMLLIAANGLFVAAEFALVAVEPSQVERAARGGDRHARTVLTAVRSLSFQLSGAQLGITATSLAVGYVAEPSIAALLKPALTAIGIPDAARTALSVAVALFLATVTQMLLGELVPKNLAVAAPMGVARAVARPQVLFSRACYPLIWLLNGSANTILRAVGVEPRDELASARSPEELSSVVRSSAEHGTIPGVTATLMRRSLGFGDRTAADVMTPRVHIVFADADAPLDEVLLLAGRTGYSRFPVRLGPVRPGAARPGAARPGAARPGAARPGPPPASVAEGTDDARGVTVAEPAEPAEPTESTESAEPDESAEDAGDVEVAADVPGAAPSLDDVDTVDDVDAVDTAGTSVDDVVGVVHVKDAIATPGDRRRDLRARDAMVPPLFVPRSLGCRELLTRLRRSGLALAVVIDEYGGVDGLVTLEDLVEELVGQVTDEHDRPATPPVTAEGERTWLLSGLLRLDEVAEATGARLPAGPYETVAGLVLHQLGHLPVPGEQVDVDGYQIAVVAMERHRIDRVRLAAPPRPETAQPDGAGAGAGATDTGTTESGTARSMATQSGATQSGAAETGAAETGADTAGAAESAGAGRRA